MDNKQLFYFTGSCLSLGDHPETRKNIIGQFSSGNFPWEKFIALGNRHLILPLLYSIFENERLLPCLPAELGRHLKEIHARNTARNIQIIKQAGEITALLNKNDIYPVLMKGTANILDGLYPAIGDRMIGDIDFLVAENDYKKTAVLLENEGYSISLPFYGNVDEMKHYPRLFRADVPADVEVHRLPVPEKYCGWFNPQVIEREKKTVDSPFYCFVPSDKHKGIHNFIHSQLSNRGYGYGVATYRDLYDLYLLSKRTSLAEMLREIPAKQKATAYFSLLKTSLNTDSVVAGERDFSSRLYLGKHNLNLKSRSFSRSNYTLVYLTGRLRSYLQQALLCFHSGKARRSVIQRLTSHEWRRNHIRSYRNCFIR